MTNKDFTYTFNTSQSTHQVYELLLNIDQWWSGLFDEKIKGKSKKENDEFTFNAGDGVHYSKQKLIELVPDQKIVWRVTESNLSFLTHTSEWNGTELQFDLSKEGKQTKVTFTHKGLVAQFECYEACSGAWTGYLDNLKKKLS